MKNIITIIITVLTMMISFNTYSQENSNYFYVVEEIDKSLIKDSNMFNKLENKIYEPTEEYYKSIRSEVNGNIYFLRTFNTLELANYCRKYQFKPKNYVILKISKDIENVIRLKTDDVVRDGNDIYRKYSPDNYHNSIIQKQSLELMHQNRINRSF